MVSVCLIFKKLLKCTILHSYQQCIRVPSVHIFPNRLLWSVFLILGFLIYVLCYPMGVLICISLSRIMLSIFCCACYPCIFFDVLSVQTVCPSFILFFILLSLSFNILVINPLSYMWFINIFAHSELMFSFC